MPRLPDSEIFLLVRTYFGMDDSWEALREMIEEGSEEGFLANVIFVDDRQFEGFSVEELEPFKRATAIFAKETRCTCARSSRRRSWAVAGRARLRAPVTFPAADPSMVYEALHVRSAAPCPLEGSRHERIERAR
jgi:hypothetical protein